MKIDRRSFLSLGIGAVAGTALSPLPWKITDDLSIWTQRWPWTPVPENGKASYVTSVCMLCSSGGCGISVRKINDRAVKIEGMKGHPVNNGGICALGLSGLQLLYGPSRIKSPLKRVGKRGDGHFRTISWGQAIHEVADKLGTLRSEDRPHTVACISGRKSGTVASLLKRFLRAYGSPNFMYVPSAGDAYATAVKMMHGVDAAVDIDIENSDYVLSFSSGVLEGWGSPVRMAKAGSRLKSINGKWIQFESRMSDSAAKADQWIPIAPGTEGLLAMGFINVILQESLYDKAFVENYGNGFDLLENHVLMEYPLDKVSRATGVDSAVIIAQARNFARASAPLAICGRGQGDVPGALSESMAVHTLNALVGNINQKGGVWAVPKPEFIRWPEPRPDETAHRGLGQKRMDGGGTGTRAASLLNRFPEAMNSGNGYAAEVLLISEANPLYTMKDSKAVKAAFDKIGLIVNFSSYMDETVLYSDIILPNHCYLERYEDVVDASGRRIGLAKPVVNPIYHTRHTGNVILEMAKALKGMPVASFPWSSYESCLRQTLGHRWRRLIEYGYWMDHVYAPAPWMNPVFTLFGKFEFVPPALKEAVFTAPEGETAAYPLVLMPYDCSRIANDYIGNPPFMTKTISDTVLKGKEVLIEINPQTAKELMLAEGKTAELSTPKGKAVVKIHLSERIGPGLIAMAKGLGHWAGGPYLAEKGVNINALMGPVNDPVSGMDAGWGIRARLSKI